MTPKTDIRQVFGTDEDFMLDSFEDTSSFVEEEEVMGQLAVDIYQTEKDVVLKAPIAGVKADDLDINVTDELVSIKGQRKEEKEVREDSYHSRECYWGTFYRSVTLPVAVVPDKASAKFKDGILTIRIPKASQGKLRKIKVVSE